MFIAVEGCIGAGKSTVAKGLAARRSSVGLSEEFEWNPFLRAFAADPQANALETEFGFLLIHFHQLKSIRQIAEDNEVVADFHLGKDLLYADLNIAESSALEVFRSLYGICVKQIPPVDLLVFLSAPDALILDRIKQRERDFELELEPDYYVRINAAYEDFFAAYPGEKLLVRMTDYDFVRQPGLFDELSSRIDARLRRGPE